MCLDLFGVKRIFLEGRSRFLTESDDHGKQQTDQLLAIGDFGIDSRI